MFRSPIIIDYQPNQEKRNNISSNKTNIRYQTQQSNHWRQKAKKSLSMFLSEMIYFTQSPISESKKSNFVDGINYRNGYNWSNRNSEALDQQGTIEWGY